MEISKIERSTRLKIEWGSKRKHEEHQESKEVNMVLLRSRPDILGSIFFRLRIGLPRYPNYYSENIFVFFQLIFRHGETSFSSRAGTAISQKVSMSLNYASAIPKCLPHVDLEVRYREKTCSPGCRIERARNILLVTSRRI